MMLCKYTVVQSASCNTTGLIDIHFQPCFQSKKTSGHPGWAPFLLIPSLLLSFPGQNKFPLLLLLSAGFMQPKLRLAVAGGAPSQPISLTEKECERDKWQHRYQENILEEGKENTVLSQISKCLFPVPRSDWHTCKRVYRYSCTK